MEIRCIIANFAGQAMCVRCIVLGEPGQSLLVKRVNNLLFLRYFVTHVTGKIRRTVQFTNADQFAPCFIKYTPHFQDCGYAS